MRTFLAKLKFLIGWNRIAISLFCSLVLLLLASPSWLSLMIGSLIVMAGAALRTWSSGYVKKNMELSMDGPYAHVRHPLYVGNFLLGLGFSVMANRWFLVLAFLVIFYVLYASVIHEEERILRQTFGRAYAEYSKKVPTFIPSFGRRGPQTGRFTWELVRQHREHQTWLGILGGICLLAAKMVWLHGMAG
jgi:protein-S-isoprenylcysteine O-methyltransferase Ste14